MFELTFSNTQALDTLFDRQLQFFRWGEVKNFMTKITINLTDQYYIYIYI